MNISHSWLKCPKCLDNGYLELLSTSSEWQYYCSKCRIRFNDNQEIRPDDRWVGKAIIPMITEEMREKND